MKKTILFLLFVALTSNPAFAGTVVIQGAGPNAAAIQTFVDQFRAALGGNNNGVGGSFTSGRREINWDGVPDTSAEPNFLAPDFFNTTSPRGLVMNTLEILSGGGLNDFRVSADSSNPTNTANQFGNIDTSYQTIFQPFSGERIFAARNTHAMEVFFFIPGTKIPATVRGFGAVFLDVDTATASSGRAAQLRCYSADNTQLISFTTSPASNGMSFGGVYMNSSTDPGIARCVIQMGNTALATGVGDTAETDVVAMDDFIYGEPRASQFHSGDFDGDGVTDTNVFRPSIGTWFTLNSGSNTVVAEQFGLNGDIPVDGDFDGDSRADVAIFRPSDGTWFFKRSSNGTVLGAQFGQNGDKPVVGDYDKDGRSDIAIFRPSTGTHFVLRSNNNFTSFYGHAFGTNGDIPVQGGAQ